MKIEIPKSIIKKRRKLSKEIQEYRKEFQNYFPELKALRSAIAHIHLATSHSKISYKIPTIRARLKLLMQRDRVVSRQIDLRQLKIREIDDAIEKKHSCSKCGSAPHWKVRQAITNKLIGHKR